MESSPMTPFPAALALIPARGGSKGIPGKNLQAVGGRPLVVRSIDAAQASEGVERVVVSTDDAAIRAAALAAGAEVVNRPPAIAGDTASSESALLHALTALEQNGPLPERLVFLQCTSPFTSAGQIDRVLGALDDPTINSSFAVQPWHGFLWREDGRGINHDPTRPRQRRQDLEPAYLETGAIYAMRTAAFRQSGSRFCAPWKPVVLNDSGPEIDTPADLALCRSLEAVNSPEAE
ncbi:MAG: cytidylyltransferase domain-containing protein [Synechococcus sp.]